MQEERPQDSPGWQFKADEAPEALPVNPLSSPSGHPVIESVEWTASEYIAHHKTPGWFILLGVATAALALIVYLVTRGDKVSAAMIIVGGVFFGIIGARPPRVLSYVVSDAGIQIDKKFYHYGEFKTFSVVDEGGISSIMLLPLKRWMPPITIYYAPADEHKIVTVLSRVLPVEQRQPDALDRLMRRVRF